MKQFRFQDGSWSLRHQRETRSQLWLAPMQREGTRSGLDGGLWRRRQVLCWLRAVLGVVKGTVAAGWSWPSV